MMICFEGIDASGKATQSKLLAEKMGATRFSFPDYDTPTGHLILGHLKEHWFCHPASTLPCDVPAQSQKYLNALVFQALQLTNRMEHAEEIAQLLKMERHVVADRYWPSGVAYGGADGLDPDYVRGLHHHLPQPDLYLLMDIDPRMSVERRPERRDRYEMQKGLMEELAGRYRHLWNAMEREQGRKRWTVINARGSIEETQALVLAAVQAVGWRKA